MNITVIYHSGDFDGIFCRQIARKFLGDQAHYIGWDFKDKPLPFPEQGDVYVLDLPVDRVFGFDDFSKNKVSGEGFLLNRVIWIDHHISSIKSHPKDLQGFQLDGVAACRLAWQWFSLRQKLLHPTAGSFSVPMPNKQDFIDRRVEEPCAVRMAGEYDIWDKRNPNVDIFQFALRAVELTDYHWEELLSMEVENKGTGMDIERSAAMCAALMPGGCYAQTYQQNQDKVVMGMASFILAFEGLKFLALNAVLCNSLAFAPKDVPETGHDALLAFGWVDGAWKVSMYHARHNTGIDHRQDVGRRRASRCLRIHRKETPIPCVSMNCAICTTEIHPETASARRDNNAYHIACLDGACVKPNDKDLRLWGPNARTIIKNTQHYLRGSIRVRGIPLWSMVGSMTGHGSGYSAMICKSANIDPFQRADSKKLKDFIVP